MKYRQCRYLVWLVAAVAASASCSVLNRTGPLDTCTTLDGGAINSCHDGIIESCVAGRVVYEVCDHASACEAAWQLRGAFRCTQLDIVPSSPVMGAEVDASDLTGCAAGCAVTALASAPSALAVSGRDLFYCAESAVWRVPKASGKPKRLGEVPSGCTTTMFVDDADVWLLSMESPAVVVAISKVGGVATAIYEDTRGAIAFGIDGGNMYWINGVGALTRRPKKGIATDTGFVADSLSFRAGPLDVDDGRVIWLSPTGISSIAITGGPTESVNLPEIPTSHRIESGAMFWTAPTRGIVKSSVRFGDSIALAPADPSATSIALDSLYAYWSETSRIARVSKNGGTVETIIQESSKTIAADDDGVYWYANGQIRAATH